MYWPGATKYIKSTSIFFKNDSNLFLKKRNFFILLTKLPLFLKKQTYLSNKFIEKYGHIRPNTYNIKSLNYKNGSTIKITTRNPIIEVQVSSSDANPVVCKLLDYGKHIFEKKKNTSSSKVKVKRNTVKEIKFRPSTDTGDYNIKLKKIKSFILGGDKTKISVRFRGREILNSNLGLDLLNKIRVELEEVAQVDQDPSLEGRQLLMVLSPLKKK